MAKIPFPGTSSPAVGFEQPFEMLEACHDRVRNSLALLGRLLAHIDANGHDAQSRAAAADVLRYFDIAAPLHHEDEERHVFPLLTVAAAELPMPAGRSAAPDAELKVLAERLQADHLTMAAEWQALRATLSAWTAGTAEGPVGDAVRRGAERFTALYAPHLEIEETRIFPAARARLDAAQLASMGAEMASRRRR